MVGRLLLQARNKFGHGPRVAYYRDVVRPRILKTAPINTASGGVAEVVVLSSHNDLLNLLWSLKSFYHQTRENFPLVILDDGSFTGVDTATVLSHFPNARLILAERANSEVPTILRGYPLCARFREFHPLARKIFDAAFYLSADRMLLLDSDLVFFRKPEELLAAAAGHCPAHNAFNEDVQPGLNISGDEATIRFDIQLLDRFNSGCGVLRREALRLDWMEEFLSAESIWNGHPWRIEQTLLALAACRDGAALLPSTYRVSLEAGIEGCVMRHYVGAVRHLMYREGIATLMRKGLLNSLNDDRTRLVQR